VTHCWTPTPWGSLVGAAMLPLGHVQPGEEEKAPRWQSKHCQKAEDASITLPTTARIWVHNNVSPAAARRQKVFGTAPLM